MKRFVALTLSVALVLPVVPLALGQAMAPAPTTGPVYAKIPVPSMIALLPPPPAQTSDTTREEIKLLKKLERSPAPEKAAALADAKELDVFVYRNVMGEKFARTALPKTAALSDQIRVDSDYWNGVLKSIYQRPRPYRYDSTLRASCGKDGAFSYPSGHSMIGYLEAMMLAEMVPEQREAIFKRADDYAHNRWVCGSHYPSDTKMSHEIAATLFGIMLANPEFEEALSAARVETREQLGLPAQAPER
jgi:acid phosphatase (class A)